MIGVLAFVGAFLWYRMGSEAQWVEQRAETRTNRVQQTLENQITLERAQTMQCRMIIEAANGPTTMEAEKVLHEGGIDVIPDILANTGGVIVSYFEWLQNRSAHSWALKDIQTRFRDMIWEAHDNVMNTRKDLSCSRREAAYAVALHRLREVYDRRGIFP